MAHDDFDRHAGAIDDDTPVTATYRDTRNVRRFFRRACGDDFRFDRPFMNGLKTHPGTTMGEAAREWRRRRDARTAD